MEITTAFILAQIFGLLASAAYIASVQFKKKSHILLLMLSNSLLGIVSFALLEAWAGTIIYVVGTFVATTIYLLEKHDKKVSWPIIVAFVVAEIVPWTIGYQDWYDILPLAGTLLWIVSMLQRDENRLRWFIIISSVLWVIYEVITNAYVMVLTDGFAVASAVIAIIRFRKGKDVKTKNN